MSHMRRANLFVAILLCFSQTLPPARVHADHEPLAIQTTVSVTTSTDTMDGDVSTFDALIASPGADNQISLREAMHAAEAMPATDGALTIGFAIPEDDPGYDLSTGTWQIRIDAILNQPLPVMGRGSVTIDGATQPSTSNLPSIILDGFDLYQDEGFNNGLVITSSLNLVRGIAFVNFYDTSIVISGPEAHDNRIEGNLIGDTPRGDLLEQSYIGVAIDNGATNNQIGGTIAQRNYILRHKATGVDISGEDTSGNRVLGNWIGLAPDGSESGNSEGVVVRDGASDNQIGAPTMGNLLGSNDVGVALRTSFENSVQGNWIGLAPDGRTPRPNRNIGLLIARGAHSNQVGGPSPGQGNVIAATGDPEEPGGGQGIYIFGIGSNENVVQGNYIGTTSDGLGPAGNLRQGVLISSGAQFNEIGGDRSGEANVITYNGLGGVRIDSNDNSVIGNLIGVAANGVTALGNQFNGVRVGGDRNAVIANTIVNNQAAGVLVLGSEAHITLNYLANNAVAGTCLAGEQATVELNTITENGTPNAESEDCQTPGGIIVSSEQARIISNSIHNNVGAGVFITNGQRNHLQSNSITGNAQGGIMLENGGNAAIEPPTITRLTKDQVAGEACVSCTVEVFADLDDQGRDILGSGVADAEGRFVVQFSAEPGDRNVTATQSDPQGNTSAFTPAQAVPPPPVTFEIYLPVVNEFEPLPPR